MKPFTAITGRSAGIGVAFATLFSIASASAPAAAGDHHHDNDHHDHDHHDHQHHDHGFFAFRFGTPGYYAPPDTCYYVQSPYYYQPQVYCPPPAYYAPGPSFGIVVPFGHRR
jgi:hypothetical protein